MLALYLWNTWGLLLYATGKQPLHVMPCVHHPQGTQDPRAPSARTPLRGSAIGRRRHSKSTTL